MSSAMEVVAGWMVATADAKGLADPVYSMTRDGPYYASARVFPTPEEAIAEARKHGGEVYVVKLTPAYLIRPEVTPV